MRIYKTVILPGLLYRCENLVSRLVVVVVVVVVVLKKFTASSAGTDAQLQ
jgi:hypothetical protein